MVERYKGPKEKGSHSFPLGTLLIIGSWGFQFLNSVQYFFFLFELKMIFLKNVEALLNFFFSRTIGATNSTKIRISS